VTLLAAVLAVLVGVTLGLLGGGGAILTVPIFVYALGIPMKSAVPMSLLVIGSASALGAIQRWLAGQIRPGRAFGFALLAVPGAFAGAELGVRIPERWQLGIFAISVLVAAWSMWRSARSADVTRRQVPRALAIATPVAVGMLTGMIGIGGGFLFVPALVALLGVPMIEATGLSLVVITINSAAAVAWYYGYGQADIAWKLVLPFAGIVIAATLVSGPFAARIPAATLKRVFAIVLVAIGSFVLFENLR
jgi:uncharacterized membrane protein YfcA